MTQQSIYRDLQVGLRDCIRVELTQANIIGNNTVHLYSIEIQVMLLSTPALVLNLLVISVHDLS